MIDAEKDRREFMRWIILLALSRSAPNGAYEELILNTVRGVIPDATDLEIRTYLGYLSHRNLIDLRKEPSGHWYAELNRNGIDVAEYTVECEPGIARPPKYWGK